MATQEEPTVLVEVTSNEALYLSDRLSIYHYEHPDSEEYSPFPGLLLKISAVILADAPIKVALTSNDLWCIREEAKSSVKIGVENVGLNLLKKVYKALLGLAAESVAEGLPQSEADEGTYRQRAKLETPEKKAKKGENYSDY